MQKFESTDEEQPGATYDWRRYDDQGMTPILQAALDAIVEVGYHGTTIRKIAQRSGLLVPGVYHYYPSKQALLLGIMEFPMEDLWERTRRAVAEADGSPQLELDRYVECMVLFHASQRALAATALTEIRSLDPEARKKHIQRRDRQHKMLDDIIARGATAGTFGTPYPRQATTAIITMCTSVAQWFNPDGDLSPAELADRYQHFAQCIAE